MGKHRLTIEFRYTYFYVMYCTLVFRLMYLYIRQSHGNKRSSLLLHSVAVIASISVDGVAYHAITIFVYIKER